MIINRVKGFVDTRGLSVYRFWKETGISKTTAYNLYNDPGQPLSNQILDAICTRYKVQPNEIIMWVDA